jgi:hypothetical protein
MGARLVRDQRIDRATGARNAVLTLALAADSTAEMGQFHAIIVNSSTRL